jgi:hypothetical protein
MVYGCGNNCVKYLVFVFNFLIFVVGIAVLATSLSVLFSNVAREYFQKILGDAKINDISLDQMNIPLYVLAAIGALLIITGFLGCCGACMENTCLLALFFSIILILFVAELACGIAILVNKQKVKDELDKGFLQAMKQYHGGSKELRDAIDGMQQKLECCGCQGPTDFQPNPPPGSCKGVVGCCDKIWSDLESKAKIVGGVAIGILFIELLAMIFSCILCQAFKRGDYYHA